MDESVKQLWTFCIWYAGLSATVTIGLFGWLIGLSNRVAVKENIHTDLSNIKRSLEDIRTALVGDYEKKGLVTKHHELESRVQELESGK